MWTRKIGEFQDFSLFYKSVEVITILLLALFCTASAGSSVTWVRNNSTGISYWWAQIYNDFNSARIKCFQEEATLALIKNAADRAFLHSNVIAGLENFAWIGVNQNEGEWQFTDGSSTSQVGNFWAPGDPSTDQGQLCAVINKGYFTWIDHSCSYSSHFICQKYPIINGCPSTDWFSITGSTICYKIYSGSYQYDEAVSMCNGEGYDILMPKNRFQDIFLSWYIETYIGAVVWIGYTDRVDEGSFVWDSGDQSSFTAWNDGEPAANSRDCAIYAQNTNNYQYLHPYSWFTTPCTQFYRTICQSTSFFEPEYLTTEMTSSGMPTVGPTTETYSTQEDTTVMTTLTTIPVASTTSDTITTELESTVMTTISSASSGCLCSCNLVNITLEEYLQLFRDNIMNSLAVDKQTLSKNVRKLNSAPDERQSSERIGYVGIAVLITTLCLLIVSDIVACR